MKKKIILTIMTTALALTMSGCTTTKTVSYTDEDGNTTTTTTTTNNGESTTVTENTDADGNITSHEADGYITASLKFINLTGKDIYELYIVPDYSDNWGNNIISEENAPLADGEYIAWNDAFTYSENDLIWDILFVDGDGTEINFSGLDVSQAEDKNNIEFTFEYSNTNGFTASVIGPINQEESEYSVVQSDDGIKVTYNPEYFLYEEGGEYEGSNSICIRCIIDKENEYKDYIDVSSVEGYTAQELIEGIAFQNDTEATPTHIVFANGEYDGYYCEKKLMDDFIISFYTIEGKDAPYLIEVGSHIYPDDDENAYFIAGVMEETFLSLEFDI